MFVIEPVSFTITTKETAVTIGINKSIFVLVLSSEILKPYKLIHRTEICYSLAKVLWLTSVSQKKKKKSFFVSRNETGQTESSKRRKTFRALSTIFRANSGNITSNDSHVSSHPMRLALRGDDLQHRDNGCLERHRDDERQHERHHRQTQEQDELKENRMV